MFSTRSNGSRRISLLCAVVLASTAPFAGACRHDDRPTLPQPPPDSAASKNPLIDRFRSSQGSYRVVSRSIYEEQPGVDIIGTANIWVTPDGVVHVTGTYPVHPYRYWGCVWHEPEAGIRSWFLNVTPEEIDGTGQLFSDGRIVLRFPVAKKKTLELAYAFEAPGELVMTATELKGETTAKPEITESWTRVSEVPDRTWPPHPGEQGNGQ